MRVNSAGGLPESFGPYRVVEKLGEGGMGVVYLAVSPDFQLVAVKALRPWLVGGGEGRARFAREVAVMRRVRGARVAEVLDADVDADPAFVVTRYIRGPALPSKVADHGPLRDEALTRLATGLLEALATVHAAGLVHRDVKPGNVLMTGRDPVLIDFGLARAVDETRLTTTGMVAGTPGYLAPETIIGAEPTPATDVHGWAATVSFAGTGRPPFGSGPDSVVLDRIRRGEHDTDGLPEPLASLVLAAFHDDPTKRPTIGELRRDLIGVDAASAEEIPAGAGGAAPLLPAAGVPAAPAPPQRPDDTDTAETAAIATAPADDQDQASTVADAARVSSQPGPSDHTVVIGRPPDPPTTVQPAPPREQPSEQARPTRSPKPTRPAQPHQHPYAGDGAPLRSWPARLVVMAAGFALVTLGGLLPWVGAGVLLAAMILGRMVWRIRRRMYERAVSRGPRKSDRVVVAMSAPLDLLLSVGPALGQAVVAIGAGALVGLALNPLTEGVGERTPVLVGALTAAAVSWWGPWAGRFRHGIRVLVAPMEQHHRAGWVVAAVFFVTGWVFALLWEVYGTSWWPGDGPPNPLGL